MCLDETGTRYICLNCHSIVNAYQTQPQQPKKTFWLFELLGGVAGFIWLIIKMIFSPMIAWWLCKLFQHVVGTTMISDNMWIYAILVVYIEYTIIHHHKHKY
jgi:hypothetical protein